jgi:hypothetical protein
MGCSFEDLKAQDDDWNPSKPILKFDETMNKMVPTQRSFLYTWNHLSLTEKNFSLRPPLPLPSWRRVDADQGRIVPLVHRQYNTHVEALEFVIKAAIADEKLDQQYINKVLEEYGVFQTPPHDLPANASSRLLHNKCQNASAINMEEAFKNMQFGTQLEAANGMELDQQLHSPMAKLALAARQRDDTTPLEVNLRSPEHRRNNAMPTLVNAEIHANTPHHGGIDNNTVATEGAAYPNTQPTVNRVINFDELL